jgi:hypothetical protein
MYDAFDAVLPSGASLPSLSALSYLTSIDIHHARLLGDLSNLGTLPKLSALRLENCSLPRIPAISTTNLVYLDVQGNNLAGDLVTTLSALDLSNIITLDLSMNAYTGDASQLSWSTRLPKVTTIRLNANRLTGSMLPLTKLPLISSLTVDGNALNGRLQDVLWDANASPTLSLLYASGMKLTGPLPAYTTSTLPKLSKIDLSYNSLTGPIPQTWFSNFSPKLSTLKLGHNNLTGLIPSNPPASLMTVDLSANQFSCPVPNVAVLLATADCFCFTDGSFSAYSMNKVSACTACPAGSFLPPKTVAPAGANCTSCAVVSGMAYSSMNGSTSCMTCTGDNAFVNAERTVCESGGGNNKKGSGSSSSSSDDAPVGGIVAGVLAGVILIAVAAVGGMWLLNQRRLKKQGQRLEDEMDETGNPTRAPSSNYSRMEDENNAL